MQGTDGNVFYLIRDGIRVRGKVVAGRVRKALRAVFRNDHGGYILYHFPLARSLRGGVACFQQEGERLLERGQRADRACRGTPIYNRAYTCCSTDIPCRLRFSQSRKRQTARRRFPLLSIQRAKLYCPACAIMAARAASFFFLTSSGKPRSSVSRTAEKTPSLSSHTSPSEAVRK